MEKRWLQVNRSGILDICEDDHDEELTWILLPLERKGRAPIVLAIGHNPKEPLLKELLNIYLAVASLVKATILRHATELAL